MSARLFVLAAPMIALLTLVSSPSPAFAATPELAFSPAAATVAVGSDGNVDITIGGVDAEPGLGGYDIALSFDPAVVHLTSLVDAGLVTQGQNIVICNPATIDNAAGTATASCGTLPIFGFPGVAVAAAAPLMHAVFSAQAAGSTTLSLAGSVLEDPAGGSVTATLVAGSITVPGAAAATATTAPTGAAPTATSVREAGAPSASAVAGAGGAPSATAAASTASAGNRQPAPGNVAPATAGATTANGTRTLPSTGVAAGPSPPPFDRDVSLVLVAVGSVALSAGLAGLVRERRS